MIRIKYRAFVATAALVFAADAAHALEDSPKPAAAVGKTAAVAPAIGELSALEKSAYEAWKSKDASFWDAFLSENFVGYGPSGKLDKAAATKQYAGTDCSIKSFALSEEQTRPLGKDAALVTHKLIVDGSCSGQKVPAVSWAASIYVRDGGKWKGAFHAEAPVVDPKTSSAKPVAADGAAKGNPAKPAAADAATAAMLAAEKDLWENWRLHDGKKIREMTAADISFINIFGTYLANKTDALKDWSGTGCDVKSVSVTNAVGTMLSPGVGILTFDGGADGTCYGQKVGPIWGTSVYVKHGSVWKWTFGINLPAPGQEVQPQK